MIRNLRCLFGEILVQISSSGARFWRHDLSFTTRVFDILFGVLFCKATLLLMSLLDFWKFLRINYEWIKLGHCQSTSAICTEASIWFVHSLLEPGWKLSPYKTRVVLFVSLIDALFLVFNRHGRFFYFRRIIAYIAFTNPYLLALALLVVSWCEVCLSSCDKY
jgi:hypothetical protein